MGQAAETPVPDIVILRNHERLAFEDIQRTANTALHGLPASEQKMPNVLVAWMRNKFYLAATGKTAGSLIAHRASANRVFMGMSYMQGFLPGAKEILVARNYLGAGELQQVINLEEDFRDSLFETLQRPHGQGGVKHMSCYALYKLLKEFLEERNLNVKLEAGFHIPKKVAKKLAEGQRQKVLRDWKEKSRDRQGEKQNKENGLNILPFKKPAASQPKTDTPRKTAKIFPFPEKAAQLIRALREDEVDVFKVIREALSCAVDYRQVSDRQKENFFADIQNLFHRAAHGQTAAEMVFRRVDHKKPDCGLSNWRGGKTSPVLADMRIAKNYLGVNEMSKLKTLSIEFLTAAAEDFAAIGPSARLKDWHEYTAFSLAGLSGKPLPLEYTPTVRLSRVHEKINTEWAQFQKQRGEDLKNRKPASRNPKAIQISLFESDYAPGAVVAAPPAEPIAASL